MNSDDYTDLIENYLDESLSTEEEKAFNLLRKNDPGFQKEIELHQVIRQGIEYHNLLEVHEHLKQLDQLSVPANTLSNSYYKYAAAVLLLFFVGGFSWWFSFNQKSDNSLFQFPC